MKYVLKDDSGDIIAVYAMPQSGVELESVPENSPEIAKFYEKNKNDA